jgi:hypothetical protein
MHASVEQPLPECGSKLGSAAYARYRLEVIRRVLNGDDWKCVEDVANATSIDIRTVKRFIGVLFDQQKLQVQYRQKSGSKHYARHYRTMREGDWLSPYDETRFNARPLAECFAGYTFKPPGLVIPVPSVRNVVFTGTVEEDECLQD